MQTEITSKQLRSFGLTVGGVFAAIGIWPAVLHGFDPRWWAVVVSAWLLLPAIVYPRSLFWVHKGWMFIGHILGWINTRIILGLVFYAVVTPIGFVRSLMHKDPMGRRLRPDLQSYRVARKSRPPSHLMKQY